MARARGRPSEQESLRIAREPLLDELTIACAASHHALMLPTAERSRELEDSFFRVAAALEGFFTDWFVRCLSFDSSQFAFTSEVRAEAQALNDLARWAPANRLWKRKNRTPQVHVSIPVELRPTQTEAAAYLGWSDSTKSFRGASELEDLASDFLVARFSARVAGLSVAQKQVIDATIAVRNVLAHRSVRGVTLMNNALADGRLSVGLRRSARRVSSDGVGNYMRAEAAGSPRFHAYFAQLEVIAYALAPGLPQGPVCP
jgi:hypothetical protein